MKKNALSLLVAGMCLFACTKDSNTEDTAPEVKKKYPISVDLTEFIQKTESLDDPGARKTGNGKTGRDSSLRKITDIYYLLLYPPSNYLLTYRHQNIDTDSAHFGEIRDTLYSNENYIIYLLASDTIVNIQRSGDPYYINTGINASGDFVPFKDLFATKIPIRTDTGNMPLQPILTRAVGNLQVEVLDGGLNPFYNISVAVSGEYSQVGIDNLIQGTSGVGASRILYLQKTSSTLFSSNIINTTGTLTVTITAKHKYTGDEIQKVVNGVVCYKNKRTTVTGSMGIPGAAPSSSRDFQVKVNEGWDPNDNNIGF